MLRLTAYSTPLACQPSLPKLVGLQFDRRDPRSTEVPKVLVWANGMAIR